MKGVRRSRLRNFYSAPGKSGLQFTLKLMIIAQPIANALEIVKYHASLRRTDNITERTITEFEKLIYKDDKQ
jgi:hypothetical protein